jgi:glutamate-1-semialdehyde 2,1-aminomutase
MSYQERLKRVIPGGAHTYSRGADQFPANAPEILAGGKGAYVWDQEGRRYLDYGMALRAVTLGYADERVNAAAIHQIELGNNLTRASMVELEAAEMLVDLIPSVDMVKFAKNGSNATTAAVKIARAYTGRPYICVPRQHPFFSFDDWFIGTTALQRGIPDGAANLTLVFDYNDLASLEKHFAEHPGQIAAVMMEPATTLVPAPLTADALTAEAPVTPNGGHFLGAVQSFCRREGALFILDEMITGFRWHLHGAQSYFGVEPDLCTFGKGMANGFSVAAVAGRREVMEVGSIDKPGAERTFLLSTTHGGEMSGLGAFVKTIEIYREEDICRRLWGYGHRLKGGLQEVAAEQGVAEHFVMDGPAICLNYLTRDADGIPSMKFRALYAQEMLKQGVMMPWIAVSAAHGDAEHEITLAAARKALTVYRRALDEGVDRYLEGHELKPVFRRFN